MASFDKENGICYERAQSPELEYPIRSRRNAVVVYEVDSTTGALFCGQENENCTELEDPTPHTSSSSSSSDEELVIDVETLPRRDRRNAIVSCLLDHNGDLRFALVS